MKDVLYVTHLKTSLFSVSAATKTKNVADIRFGPEI